MIMNYNVFPYMVKISLLTSKLFLALRTLLKLFNELTKRLTIFFKTVLSLSLAASFLLLYY